MHGRDSFLPRTILLTLSLLLVCAGPALAYIGPGAGLELVGYSLGLLIWMVTAFSAMLLWPLYSFIRRLRGIKENPQADGQQMDFQEVPGAAIKAGEPPMRSAAFKAGEPETRGAENNGGGNSSVGAW
jgi:hypothetical protein